MLISCTLADVQNRSLLRHFFAVDPNHRLLPQPAWPWQSVRLWACSHCAEVLLKQRMMLQVNITLSCHQSCMI